MSYRSKTSNSFKSQSAEIVDFMQSRLPSRSGCTRRAQTLIGSADLLSIRQHLRYKACVTATGNPVAVAKRADPLNVKATATVKALLAKEFGSLRLHRHRQLLIVSHHCLEELIAGLLRVQFLGNQIEWTDNIEPCEPEGRCRISLSWGVGESLYEAETALSKQTSADLERT